MVEVDGADDDGGMIEPITVWRVRLRRGDLREHEGTLRLDDDGLVFVDRSEQEQRVAFGAIRSARRVRASPILIVVHDEDDGRAETAFYFSQPPPLEVPPPGSPEGPSTTPRPLGPFAAMRRTSKRRHQRENVKYLATKAGAFKPTIQAWADEISERRRG